MRRVRATVGTHAKAEPLTPMPARFPTVLTAECCPFKRSSFRGNRYPSHRNCTASRSPSDCAWPAATWTSLPSRQPAGRSGPTVSARHAAVVRRGADLDLMGTGEGRVPVKGVNASAGTPPRSAGPYKAAPNASFTAPETTPEAPAVQHGSPHPPPRQTPHPCAGRRAPWWPEWVSSSRRSPWPTGWTPPAETERAASAYRARHLLLQLAELNKMTVGTHHPSLHRRSSMRVR